MSYGTLTSTRVRGTESPRQRFLYYLGLYAETGIAAAVVTIALAFVYAVAVKRETMLLGSDEAAQIILIVVPALAAVVFITVRHLIDIRRAR